jgi:hypothetical protein
LDQQQETKESNMVGHFVVCTLLKYMVVQLVEALRYKPEGCGFDSRWCDWNFSLT